MAKVGLIGGGGQLAEGISAWLIERRHRVLHYRPCHVVVPGVPMRPPRPRSRLDRFWVTREEQADLDGGSDRYNWCNRWEMAAAEIFIFCLPSFLAEYAGHTLGPAMNGKYIVNLSDRFMGTAALSRSALQVNPSWSTSCSVAFNSPPALAYQRTRNDSTSLLYSKPFVVAAPVHGEGVRTAANLIEELFGIREVRWMSSSLELAFENINSIVHAVQDIYALKQCLFGRLGSLYDTETYTPEIVNRINAVTLDRDNIAAYFSRQHFRNLREFDSSTFRVAHPSPAPATAEYRHLHPLLSTVPRPEIFSAHGYEDVGWSMVPLESLGRLVAIQTPALSMLIDEWNTFMDVDYRVVGRTANSLGIKVPTVMAED